MSTSKPITNKWVIISLILFFPLGLYLMWARTNWTKYAKWVITAVFGLLVLTQIGNSNSHASNTNPSPTAGQETTSTPKATDTPSPTKAPTATPTPISYDSYGFPDDAQQVSVADIAKTPSSYKGGTLVFNCNVLSFPKDDNGNAAGLNCSDPNDYSSIIQVEMGTFDQTVKINKDDNVEVYGIGEGSASGTNAYGGTIQEAVVLETHIKDFTTGYSE